MFHMKYLVVIITFSLCLVGCSSNRDIAPDSSLSRIYTSAQKKLKAGNYRGAIQELEKLNNSYPCGLYAQQASLDLIYAYYQTSDLPLAHASIDRFLRFNPTHPNIDYVLYMRGLIDMALDDNALQELFGVDRSDRNPDHARTAFQDFMQLIRRYPNSQYSMDAAKRLIYLKNRLAKHELSVVKYYNKRNAYVAVIKRVEEMLRDFPDTQSTRQALPYMEKAYRKLQLNSQANKVMKLISLNPV